MPPPPPASQMAEIAAVRREQRREPEVSFADFTQLVARVDAAAAEVTSTSDALTALEAKRVTPLETAMADLKDQVGQGRGRESQEGGERRVPPGVGRNLGRASGRQQKASGAGGGGAERVRREGSTPVTPSALVSHLQS